MKNPEGKRQACQFPSVLKYDAQSGVYLLYDLTWEEVNILYSPPTGALVLPTPTLVNHGRKWGQVLAPIQTKVGAIEDS